MSYTHGGKLGMFTLEATAAAAAAAPTHGSQSDVDDVKSAA